MNVLCSRSPGYTHIVWLYMDVGMTLVMGMYVTVCMVMRGNMYVCMYGTVCVYTEFRSRRAVERRKGEGVRERREDGREGVSCQRPSLLAVLYYYAVCTPSSPPFFLACLPLPSLPPERERERERGCHKLYMS